MIITRGTLIVPWVLLGLVLLTISCSKSEDTIENINIISATVNGTPLTGNTLNVPVDATVQFNFSKALDQDSFESAFEISEGNEVVEADFLYIAGSTAVQISLNGLKPGTHYSLEIDASLPIGLNGERLGEDFAAGFQTQSGGLITEASPCLTAGEPCSVSMVPVESSGLRLEMYSSYPLFDTNYRLENIKNLVVVIHGQNRDSDEYFNSFMTALRNIEKEESTLLISPRFSNASQADNDEYFWSSNSWRVGAQSSNTVGSISSFLILENIIEQVLTSGSYPAIQNVLVTGHSSGATLTHLFGGVLDTELYQNIAFSFDVQNNQYLYYPDDERWDDALDAYTEPSSCSDFNHWPYGYVNAVDYLNGMSELNYNNRWLDSRINYILGTADTISTGTLNTSDCAAVLLGKNRYDRGNKLIEYLDSKYGSTHNHTRLTVNNVGHDAHRMFNSPEYRMRLMNLLGE